MPLTYAHHAPTVTGNRPGNRAYREELLIGPPGCGKTTELGRQVRAAVELSQQVMVCSLTRASAAEIAGRDLPVSPDAVGTLHSHCFQALGQPILAEDKTYLEDWNNTHPAFALTINLAEKNQSLDEDNLEPTAGASPGDELRATFEIMRARMETPPPGSDVANFGVAWTAWKQANSLMDFTDLIEVALMDVQAAPGNPDVIYVDEAQDMDMLEMTLLRKWAAAAGRLVAVGDPDQAIYIWRGADPKAFSTPATAESSIQVLEQSYRVPRSVHEKAVDWIDRIPDRRRVVYHPRASNGEFKRVEATFKFPELALKDAEAHIADGKTVMFLTSCAYMLTNLIDILRQTGTPFWNPNRKSNGSWNPLQRRSRTTSAADRIVAFRAMFESSHWTAEDIYRWSNALRISAVVQSGGRGLIKDLKDGPEGSVDWDTLMEILTPEAMEAGLTGDLDWYEENLVASKRQPAIFPLTVARNKGLEALEQQPQVVVGTIHSAKGSEADVIYVFPDISRAGMSEWLGSPQRQASVFRLFYVAMTRAKEKLVICNPATRAHVNI